MPKTTKPAPSSPTNRIAEAQNAIQAAADAIQSTLDGIERDLDVRRTELRELRARPVPRDKAVALLDHVLAELTGGSEFGAAALLDGDARHLTARLVQAGGASIVAKLFSDDLRVALLAELDQAAEQRGGWPKDTGEDRAREVERLSLEILELETALSSAVKQARKSGIPVPDYEGDPDFQLTYRPPPEPPRAPRPEEEVGTFDASPVFGGQPLGAKASKRPAWAMPPARRA
jgi:hypothetical protein